MEIWIESGSLQLCFDNRIYLDILYDESYQPTNYTFVYRHNGETIKYEQPIDSNWTHLFDISLQDDLEHFEPSEPIDELFREYDLTRAQKGHLSIMILVGLILGVHVLLTDDDVGEDLGHEYLVHECAPAEISRHRILRILSLFVIMKRLGTACEQLWGTLGYQLGILLLECFREDPDTDLSVYNTAVSYLIFQHLDEMSRNPIHDRVPEPVQKSEPVLVQAPLNYQEIEAELRTRLDPDFKRIQEEIERAVKSQEGYLKWEQISDRFNTLEVKVQGLSLEKLQRRLANLEIDLKKMADGYLQLLERQSVLEKQNETFVEVIQKLESFIQRKSRMI